MSGPADSRSGARVFDTIAEDYTRHRATYPEALVDRACQVAKLGPGAEVLEIGCGTGQLTRSLLSRGLRVTAVEPGERLIARARIELESEPEIEFVNASLEQAALPCTRYRAVFSASAIHWVDPDVSWRRMAEALADGGSLALLSYFGLREPSSEPDQQALRGALARAAPELASEWPAYRDLDALLAGAGQRRANVSELWSWLGGYQLERDEAGLLFGPAELTVVVRRFEHTAEELAGLLGTMSFWAGLTAEQRDAVRAGVDAIQECLSRPIRSSTAACLVTARRELSDRVRCRR